MGLSIVIRLLKLASRSLSHDELISVTFASLPLGDMLKVVRSADPHPPLYYIQLHLWMLLGTTDFWIRLNSVLWSVAAVLSLYVITKKLFSEKLALICATLFTLSPVSVAYAQEARMYSLLMFLAVWACFFTHEFMQSTRTRTMVVGIFIAHCAFLYTHGAGFLILLSTTGYALILLLSDFSRLRRFLSWCIIQLVVMVMYMPWVYLAWSREVGHAIRPGFKDIANTLAVLSWGFGAGGCELAGWFALVFTVAVVLVALFLDRRVLNLMISFVLIPVIFCAVISYAVRPIWLIRTLTYTSPFLAFGAGYLFCRLLDCFDNTTTLKRFIRYSLVVIICLGYLLPLVYQQLTFSRRFNFRAAAAAVRSKASPGDIIYVHGKRVFWSWCWYFVGPGSVNPLTTDYVLTTPDNIKVFSTVDLDGQLVESRNVWVVYRDRDVKSFDELRRFSPYSRDLALNFHGLAVVKCKTPLR
jgi:uncharacterized membrane protein